MGLFEAVLTHGGPKNSFPAIGTRFGADLGKVIFRPFRPLLTSETADFALSDPLVSSIVGNFGP